MPKSKKCTKCGTNKSLSEFSPAKYSKNGLSPWCKECKRRKARENYDKDITTQRRLQAQQRNREFVFNYLNTHPCVDCGDARWKVLEFDHVRDYKEYKISYMVSNGFTLDHIQKEMAKCEVRCANCHRLKTANDFGFRQVIPSNTVPAKNKKKLNVKDIVEIENLLATGLSQSQIAKSFSVSQSTISLINCKQYLQ
jgi:hypothetical protein